MKISIITAVRNRASTVATAIRSIHGQLGVELEHIVIDGASTDDTLRILRAELPKNAILVSEPDTGIYSALNKGLSLATGDIVGFMHSDDFYADEHVLKDVSERFIRQPEVDAVYGDLDYVSGRDSNRVVRRWRAGTPSRSKASWGWMPPHPALFLRRSVVLQFGGFNEAFRISGDYDAILRYFVTGNIHASYLERTLVKMRTGGESNHSVKNLVIKSKEDFNALRNAGIRCPQSAFALAWKNVSKIHQLLIR